MSENGKQSFFDNGCIEGFAAGIDGAELRYSSGGTAYLRFSIPINGRRDSDVPPIWVSIVAFGKLAESVAQWIEAGLIRKGTLLRAHGRFEADEYQGTPRLNFIASKILIVAHTRNLGGQSTAKPADEFPPKDNLPF